MILVWIPSQILTFCLWSLGGPQFFHRLILLLHILNHLTPWCRLSGYLSISHSLSRFWIWLSSSLGSWEKAMWFSFQIWFFSWYLDSFFLLGSMFASIFAVYRSLSCRFWLGVSGFPVFSISVTVLGVCRCVCLYICWWISIISRSENQPFFVSVLTWSASLWFVVLNLLNSVQISIILFLYPLFAGLLLK